MARGNGRLGHIEGMAEARANLNKLNDHVQKLVAKQAVRVGADLLLDAVRVKTPVSVDPYNPTKGSLKKSLHVTRVSMTKTGARTSIRADDIAAVPNEFGTSKMSARPFFRPAVDANREAAGRAIAEEIKNEVESTPWGRD